MSLYLNLSKLPQNHTLLSFLFPDLLSFLLEVLFFLNPKTILNLPPFPLNQMSIPHPPKFLNQFSIIF